MYIWITLILSILPHSLQEEASTFSCEGRISGYYADLETGCRTYHYCIGNKQYSYECPNNTLFQQRIFICNHWYLVDCESSEQYYHANLLIGQKDKPFVEEEEPGVSISTVIQTEPTTYVTLKTEQVVTNYYEDLGKSNFTFDHPEDIQRVEKKSERPPASTPPSFTPSAKDVIRTGKSNGIEDEQNAFIKLIFFDPRGLFYIPNGNNSIDTVSPSFKEFLIPKISDQVQVMQFKNSVDTSAGKVSCPKYCHPRFIKPGSCHPCIMIK